MGHLGWDRNKSKVRGGKSRQDLGLLGSLGFRIPQRYRALSGLGPGVRVSLE